MRRLAWLALAVAGLALLAVWPISGDLRSFTVRPVPGFVPHMVDWLVQVVHALRIVSPYLAAVGLIALGTYGVLPVWSRRAEALNDLAAVEYSGVEHVAPQHRGRVRRLVRPFRAFFAGTSIAVLAIVLVGATSGIESEVTNGPLRPIDAALAVMGGEPTALVLQSPGITFMDDSSLPSVAVASLVARDPTAYVPFGKHLFNLDDQSGLEISVPDTVYQRISGDVVDGCADPSIVLDDTLGLHRGDSVMVNDVRLRVAGVEHGIAQMNRSIGILADTTARACVEGATSTAYFGVLVRGPAGDQVRADLRDAGLAASVVSPATFKEDNRDFWRANATPLLLQIILYLALFGAMAAAGERESNLQRNVREIGTLHAGGVDIRTLRAVERRRVLRTTYRAAVLACPLMVPVAAAMNASELGVRIGVGLTEMSVGVALTLVSMLVASRRALSKFARSLDLSLAVKG
ncbi:hypothetical protein [Nocardioides maradonensis]